MPTSSRLTMPRSPCSESTGCRNMAGVPVDVNVAAILRAISPDFPTPDTITRPLAPARSSTARANATSRLSASCRTASASSARIRLPRSTSRSEAGANLRTHRLLPARPLPDVYRETDNAGELSEGHHVRSVGRRTRGVRMRLEEEAVRSSGGRGIEQCRNEAALPAARAIGALPRLLDRMRSIKDDRRLADLLQPRKTPHIDDQIAIAEEGAALRHSHFRCSPGAHLLDGAAHLLRRHPLAFLDVHGAP